jgi:hypothetical protein
VPAEAALIGAMLAKGLERQPVAWATGATAVMLVAMGAVLLWVFGVANRYALDGAEVVGIVALVGGVGGLVWLFRRHVFASFATLAASVIVIVWCVVLYALPDFERYKPVRPFSEIIRARASIGAIVGSYRFSFPSMVFYLHRPVMEVVMPDHLRAVFYSSSDVYFIMAEHEYNSIRDRLPVETFVLARQPLFDLKPKNFLDGTELQQFVLVSNRD